jgi:DNA polymerase-4
MHEGRIRKIIHIDMDAFYASIEQRDDPTLRDKPVAVGYPAKRGVLRRAMRRDVSGCARRCRQP